MHPSSSQAKEMAHESMVRNLAAQAEAIWPQEEAIFDRHPFGAGVVLDVVCCRHVIQAVPDAGRVLTEIRRVLRPGGRVHLISEDYGMLWCHPTELNADDFWQRIPWRFAAAVNCDLHVGRKTF